MPNNWTMILNRYKQRLASAGVLNSESEAELIAEHTRRCTRGGPRGQQELEDSVERNLQMREKRVPISRIFGTTSFHEVEVQVSANVFMPYPESESLVDEAVDILATYGKPTRVLDLGTGTGCLLVAILKGSSNATGVGVDINPEAIALAETNAAANGLADRAIFVLSDWGAGVSEKFDVIISNPPRVATAEIPFLFPEMKDAFLRSLYPSKRQALQVTPGKEQECHFANAAASGGSTSQRRTDGEYVE